MAQDNMTPAVVSSADVSLSSKDCYGSSYHNLGESLPSTRRIDQAHWDEWAASGIHSSLIVLNLRSISGEKAKSYLFTKDTPRTNTGRITEGVRKRYEYLDHTNGWVVEGNNPISENPDNYCVFKPDKPRLTYEDKVIKYESPNGYKNIPPIFLKVPIELFAKFEERYGVKLAQSQPFWTQIMSFNIDICITEGVKKAASMLSIGIPTISVQGIWNFGDLDTQNKDAGQYILHPYIDDFATNNRKVLIAYDQDENRKTQLAVKNASRRIGNLLISKGCKVSILSWDRNLGKGIDDLLVSNPEKKLEDLTKELYLEAYLESFKIGRMSKPQLLRFIRHEYGKRLRFNELTKNIEFNGKPYAVEFAYMLLMRMFDIDSTKEFVGDCFTEVARENSYHPIKEYLNQVSIISQPMSDIDNFLTELLGIHDSLYLTYLKKTLIAAVARIYEPGCKVDTCLVLQGKQGLGKSTFWATLAGQEGFSDSLGDIKNKDDLLKLHSAWIHEWGEVDRITSKSDQSKVKAIMSCNTDRIRLPYARTTEVFPRESIFVASVNDTQFLTDPTGSRRFWIIPVLKFIDTKLVAENRNAIWAWAVAEYNSATSWWLSKEEEDLQAQANERYQRSDCMDDELEDWLGDRLETSIQEIAHDLYEQRQPDNKLQWRIQQQLTRLGFVSTGGKIKFRGKRVRAWKKEKLLKQVGQVDSREQNPQNSCSSRDTEVSTPLSTPCPLQAGGQPQLSSQQQVDSRWTAGGQQVDSPLNSYEASNSASQDSNLPTCPPDLQTFPKTLKESKEKVKEDGNWKEGTWLLYLGEHLGDLRKSDPCQVWLYSHHETSEDQVQVSYIGANFQEKITNWMPASLFAKKG